MTFVRKSFNDVVDYVKNLKGAMQVVQAKSLANKYQNAESFNGSYSLGYKHYIYLAQPIYPTPKASTGSHFWGYSEDLSY